MEIPSGTMKRALIAIPLLSAAILLFVLLWHSTVKSPIPAVHATGSDVSAEAARSPAARTGLMAAEVSDSSSPAGRAKGSLRVLVHSGGQGLYGAEILVQPTGAAAPRRFQTMAGGARSIQDIPAGEYEIGAQHPGYLPAQTRVRVEPGQSAESSIELKEGGRILGVVVDAGGNPLPETTVTLITAGTRVLLPAVTSVKSDAAGRYVLEAIPPGDFGVRFRHERFRPAEKMGLLFRDKAEAYEMNATLEPGSTVSGRVVDEAGVPLGAASVTVSNEFGGAQRADTDGCFEFQGLGEQPIHCSASAPGYGTVYVRAILPNTRDLEIRLPRAGDLSGALEAEGDAVPPSFSVMLSRYDDYFGRVLRVYSRPFANAPAGAFRLSDVAPGTYWMEIEAEGYEPLERPQVVVQAGQTAEGVHVRLRRKR